MEQSLKDRLLRNIWITRKCRINASERLLSNAKYIELVNIYYSIFVIVLSLVSLTKHDNTLSIISLSCTIALTISIVYANATGYRERYAALKHNYIEMQMLLDQLSCTGDDDRENIERISRKYAELLESSENHVPVDLYKLKITSTDENLKIGNVEKQLYYIKYVLNFCWKAIIILLPILVIFLYCVWGKH